jgi:hypothetical protein
MKKLFLPLGLLALSLVACYTPDPFTAESAGNHESSHASANGTMYRVNYDRENDESLQICNPSISQDTVNFPGAMLWLNFSRKLGVVAPDSEYNVVNSKARKVLQHDRLTISDTAEHVLWYLMRDESKGECQFQDPEWSTHADFIVALRGYDVDGSKTCSNLDFGIFAVRPSNNAKFWFVEKGMIEMASPHLWVDPSAKIPKDGDISTVEGFFGTNNVRLVYAEGSDKPLNIVFIDYANGGKKNAVSLKKPKDRSDWKIDAPLISPDGKYVVYNMYESSTSWEAYVQELSKDAEPIKIERMHEKMSEPAQPHWFESNGLLFVLWAEFPIGSSMVNDKDLTIADDGSVGYTVMREIRLLTGVPKVIEAKWEGDAFEIAKVPMTGGLSPDGKFLATGTNNAYLLKLP